MSFSGGEDGEGEDGLCLGGDESSRGGFEDDDERRGKGGGDCLALDIFGGSE